MQVILASRSPRRLQLLQAAGLAVEVRPMHVDESIEENESVQETVVRLAERKAAACDAAEIPVIAADTLVCLDGRAIGQPATLDEAKEMIEHLSGRTHQVYTGVCTRLDGTQYTDLACTHVTFAELNDREIENYLQHNEVMDKAGAYAIQAGASAFVTAVDGPLDNVIGLPVRMTLKLLAGMST
jgi:septum formation protein